MLEQILSRLTGTINGLPAQYQPETLLGRAAPSPKRVDEEMVDKWPIQNIQIEPLTWDTGLSVVSERLELVHRDCAAEMLYESLEDKKLTDGSQVDDSSTALQHRYIHRKALPAAAVRDVALRLSKSISLCMNSKR
jgi:hypothetical protein